MLSNAIQITKMPKEQSTQQLNLRVPKDLLRDLDAISDILKVNKSEWIKIKIGELVYLEKSRLLEQYASLSDKGLVSKKEYEKLLK